MSWPDRRVMQAWAACLGVIAFDRSLTLSSSFLQSCDAFWVKRPAALLKLRWYHILVAHEHSSHQPSAALLSILEAQVPCVLLVRLLACLLGL